MNVTEIKFARDGTIEFQIEGHPVAGRYRLISQRRDPGRSLCYNDRPTDRADGMRLPAGGDEERTVLAVLEDWLGRETTPEVAESLDELRRLWEWHHFYLPERLNHLKPIRYIELVAEHLRARARG